MVTTIFYADLQCETAASGGKKNYKTWSLGRKRAERLQLLRRLVSLDKNLQL